MGPKSPMGLFYLQTKNSARAEFETNIGLPFP